ncbi:MAG: HAMP domain-containing sensor histidine kinase [Planctomycetota bacterium]
MSGIIAKRRSLYREIQNQSARNDSLKSQMSQLQALANIGTATCMIAHEINNLLTPLGGYAELALQEPGDMELARKSLEKTKRNCLRAEKILASMVGLANGQAQEKESCSLKELVDEIFTCLCRDFSKDKIKVTVEVNEALTIRAVPVQIQQVLMNLIFNARDAMAESGGSLTIRGGETDSSVWIEVCDTGSGIDRETMPHIFEAFFTTKGKTERSGRSGSGLGLAFCKDIVEAHHGSISVRSKPGKGAVFRIILPKQD